MKLPDGNSDYGIVQGVDKHGALIMQLNGTNKHYHNGELSISASPKRALSQGES